jgi:hypothetical protein
VKCAEYLPENKLYQSGSVMKNRIGLGAFKLGDDKGLKRCEWEETVTDDENVYTVMCMITNVV